jgi:kynurenine formamidase
MKRCRIAMRGLLPGLLACLAGCTATQPLHDQRVVDLSYPYDETTIYWPTEKGFLLEKGFEGTTPAGYFYTANRFWTPEHGGTHIDAPIHFHREGRTVDAIPVDQLVSPGIVVDVSQRCSANRDYQISIQDFLDWEKRYGVIPAGAIVLLRTGFGRYWPDRERYMGTNVRGEAAIPLLHFPGLHPDAAAWLADQRRVHAVGLDTPSIDYGQSTTFASHVALFARNVPALENVANLHLLPEQEFTIVALPMKIKGGSGGPVRIIALLEK